MRDITEALNQIIFKYHLDRYYPHYRNMCEADKVLRRLVAEITAAGARAAFVCDDETGNEVIRNMAKGYGGISFYLYKQNDLETLEQIDWRNYDQVYLTLFYDAEYALKWFWQREIPCEWIYDIFEREELCLEREFYALHKKTERNLWVADAFIGKRGWQNTPQLELCFQRMRLQYSENEKTRRVALEKCLFLCLYMKNFTLAESYVKLLGKNDARICAAWGEIQALLNMIRSKLRGRKKRDIILYWLDAIPHENGARLPYLKKRMDLSVSFENAFTCTPFTNPTLRTIFLGKKEMDDFTYRIKNISEENSPVLRLLKDQGYSVKIISGYFKNSFKAESWTDHFFCRFDCCSMRFWDMLKGLLEEKETGFFLVHPMEGHTPCLFSRMTFDSTDIYKMKDDAIKDLDEQLEFYDSFVEEDAIRIYMSDHGNGVWRTQHHILFNVFYKGLQPEKVADFFSILDFGTVLEQLLVKGVLDKSAVAREYVEIQDLPTYDKAVIEDILSKGRGLHARIPGYKGIIDQNYQYILFKTGREYLAERSDRAFLGPAVFPNMGDVCDASLLPKYRQLVTGFPAEMDSDDKFRYSKCICRLYDKIVEKEKMREKSILLNKLVEKYPQKSVAIRMGGDHSRQVYRSLSIENRRKIWGFVDMDSRCVCCEFGLRVISPDQADGLSKQGVQAIMLSSRDYLDDLRKEAENYVDVDILDIYACFEENGISCERNFYEVAPEDLRQCVSLVKNPPPPDETAAIQSAMEDDWLDDIVQHTVKARNGRKVVLWGKYSVSERLSQYLEAECGIETAFYVDSSAAKQNGVTVKAPECLASKASEYYVVVPLAFYPSLKASLEHYGYQKNTDYYYFCDCIVKQRDDYYEDAHGNKIIGNFTGLKFAFSGFGAVLKIEEGTEFDDCTVYIHSGSETVIGKSGKLSGTMMSISPEAKLSIGDNCEIKKMTIRVYRYAVLQIGDKFSVAHNSEFYIFKYTRVYIGDDCMFSSYIDMRTSDQHSIFDVTTGKNINSTYDIAKSRTIKIGNHVWLGLGVTILYNTEIGDGSVIGTKSLVKGKIPNNCIAAGIPAKVIRRNIAWSRKNFAEDILSCGKKYIRMTEEIDR